MFNTALRGQLRLTRAPYVGLLVTAENNKIIDNDIRPEIGSGVVADTEYFSLEILLSQLMYEPLEHKSPRIFAKLSHYVTLQLSYYVAYYQNFVMTGDDAETVHVFATGLAYSY